MSIVLSILAQGQSFECSSPMDVEPDLSTTLQNPAKVTTLGRFKVSRADRIKVSICGRSKVSTPDRIKVSI